jgi:hypothetical protein
MLGLACSLIVLATFLLLTLQADAKHVKRDTVSNAAKEYMRENA